MNCYKCRAKVRENVCFCPECGAALQITEGLIRKAAEKDAEAVEQLFYMTREQVYFTVRTAVWDENTACILLQESYIRAFKSLSQQKQPSGFLRWIKKIANQTAIEHLQKTQPDIFRAFGGAQERAMDFSEDRAVDLPEVVLELERTETVLDEILAALPSGLRVLAGLYYGQQLSANEIAELLRSSENAVTAGLNKVKEAVRSSVAMAVRHGAQTMDLAPTAYLMWLYQCLKVSCAACIPEVILHDIQKKVAGNKGKKAAKAVGAAAMAVAGESVGEVAKEGLKATITKVIAGLTATAVIGGGTGAAVHTYNENRTEKQQVAVMQEVKTEESAVSEAAHLQTKESAVQKAAHFVGDFSEVDAGSKKEIHHYLEEKYQETLENALYINIKSESTDLSLPKGYVDSISDAVIGTEGYFAKEAGAVGETGNILLVPCFITLNDVYGIDGDGSVSYTTYEDLSGMMKLFNLYVDEEGKISFEEYVEFIGFYAEEEQLTKEWIEPLESRYRIEPVELGSMEAQSQE